MSNLSNSAPSSISATNLTTCQVSAHTTPAFSNFQFKTIGQAPDLLKRMAAVAVMNPDEYDSDKDELMSPKEVPKEIVQTGLSENETDGVQRRSLRERMAIPVDFDADGPCMSTCAQPLDAARVTSASDRASGPAYETNSRDMDVDTITTNTSLLPSSLRRTANISNAMTADRRAESLPSQGSRKSSSKMPDTGDSFLQSSSQDLLRTFSPGPFERSGTAHISVSDTPQNVQTHVVAMSVANASPINMADELSRIETFRKCSTEFVSLFQPVYMYFDKAEEGLRKTEEAFRNSAKEYLALSSALEDKAGELQADLFQLDRLRKEIRRESEQLELQREQMRFGSAPQCQAGPSGSHVVPSDQNTVNSLSSCSVPSSVESHDVGPNRADELLHQHNERRKIAADEIRQQKEKSKKLKREKEEAEAELAEIEEQERLLQKAEDEAADRQRQKDKFEREAALKKADDERARKALIAEKQRQAHIHADVEQTRLNAQVKVQFQAQQEKTCQDSHDVQRQKLIEKKKTRIREAELRQELRNKETQQQRPPVTEHQQHRVESALSSQGKGQSSLGSQRSLSNKEPLHHKVSTVLLSEADVKTSTESDRATVLSYPIQARMSGPEPAITSNRITSSATSGGVPVSFGGRPSSLSIPQSKNVRPMAHPHYNNSSPSASSISPVIKQKPDTQLSVPVTDDACRQKALPPSEISDGKSKVVRGHDAINTTYSKVQDVTSHTSSFPASQDPISSASETQNKNTRDLTVADARGLSVTIKGEHEELKPVIKVEQDPPIVIPQPAIVQVPNVKANEHVSLPKVTHVTRIPPLSLPSPGSLHNTASDTSHPKLRPEGGEEFRKAESSSGNLSHGEYSRGSFVLDNPPTMPDVPVSSHRAATSSPPASLLPPVQSLDARDRSPFFQAPLASRMPLPEIRNGTDLLVRVEPGALSNGNGWTQSNVPHEQAHSATPDHTQTRVQLPRRPVRHIDHWSPKSKPKPRLPPRGEYYHLPSSHRQQRFHSRSLSRESERANTSRPVTPEPFSHQEASLSHKRKRTDPIDHVNEPSPRRLRYNRQYESSYAQYSASAGWSHTANFSRSPTPELPHAIPLHMRLGGDDDGRSRTGTNSYRYGGPSQRQQSLQNEWPNQGEPSYRQNAERQNHRYPESRALIDRFTDPVPNTSDNYSHHHTHPPNRGARPRGRGAHQQSSSYRNNNKGSLIDRIEAANDMS